MVSLETAHSNETRLLSYLDEKGIKYEKYSHPVVLTVEEQANHVGNVPGSLAKNLLLKDKKGRLILVTALTSTQVDLKLLSQRLGLGKGGLRMAPLENLSAVLQVPEGSVTPLAVFQESARSLPLLLDHGFQNHSRLLFHPLVNDATIALNREAFEEFLRSIGREAHYVDLEAVVAVGKDQPPDLAHFLQGSSVEAAPGENYASASSKEPSALSQSKPSDPAAPAAKAAPTKSAKAEAKQSNKGPPGDDVSACAEGILALLSSQQKQTGDQPLQFETSADSSQSSYIREELEHILVMFKNAAYTQGFVSGKATVGLRV